MNTIKIPQTELIKTIEYATETLEGPFESQKVCPICLRGSLERLLKTYGIDITK